MQAVCVVERTLHTLPSEVRWCFSELVTCSLCLLLVFRTGRSVADPTVALVGKIAVHRPMGHVSVRLVPSVQ